MLLAVVAPDAQKRVDRMDFVLRLLRCGYSPCDARRKLREQYAISRQHAWRIVDMALDMV